ncbi:MAG: DUF6048 family protein [Fulvivirga sp.]|nr:DUF6048 family protein [Fulvivirga sp.]
MRIYASIIISLICTANVLGQNKSIVPDTVKGKYIPSGIRLGFDLINFGEALAANGMDVFSKGEYRELQFTADIDFYRYFFNVEYGIFNRSWQSIDAVYNNQGSHFKIGPDVNFLHRDPDGSALFFGVRYAFTSFSDELQHNFENDFWSGGANNLSNDRVFADWLEFTSGLKVRLTNILWLGYTARFKFAVDTFEDNALIPHWIPGFGRASEATFWGFDYWLIIKIPFKPAGKS